MSKYGTTHTLIEYQRVNIKNIKDVIKQSHQDSVLYFSYTHNGKSYNYSVRLDKTACNYGGNRYWYVCPKCGRRTSVLYCAGIYMCRRCIGANYESQLNRDRDRLITKRNKIASKLEWIGQFAEIGQEIRPKGMHQKTFYNLVCQFRILEMRISKSFGADLEKLQKKIERLSST